MQGSAIGGPDGAPWPAALSLSMGSLPRDVTWTSMVGRSWGVRRKSNGTSLQEAAVSSTHALPLHATCQRDSTSLNRCM